MQASVASMQLFQTHMKISGHVITDELALTNRSEDFVQTSGEV